MASTKSLTDFVSQSSLNWALTHVLRFGENDIFPIPFEYEAYKAAWPDLLGLLGKVDLSAHEVAASLKLPMPKGKWGYRIATQMDPLDYLIYTGAVHEIAPLIESFRVAKENRVACAYRLDIDDKGQFFQKHSGWPDFQQQSDAISLLPDCKYVLCADVSDFYNQTSHHRIQNALLSALVSEKRATNIETFLGNLNSRHHSRGLPVGPSASILLAEVCLADVDAFISRKGYRHTRYVDDFRLFCKNYEEALQALHDLSLYLFTAHRLSLQSNKTSIISKEEFRRRDLIEPEVLEETSKQGKIQKLIEELDYSPYEQPDEFEIDESVEAGILRDTLREMFNEIVNEPSLNIGLARYVLRRAAALRTREILTSVVAHLQFLLPVFRDVVNYVVKAYDKKRPDQVGEALVSLIKDSDHRNVPFVQYWVLHAFVEQPLFCTAQKAIELAERAHPDIRDRMAALVARRYRLTDWVRERKETWMNTNPFGQRAIIWAASILSKTERGHWLKGVANYPIPAISFVAKGVLSQQS